MVSVTNGIADNPGGGSSNAFPQFFMTIDPVYKIPRSYNWNVTYQRQLTGDTTVEVGYVGTIGNYLSRERDLNQLPTGTTFQPENAGRQRRTTCAPTRASPTSPCSSTPAAAPTTRLQFEVNRRFTKGLLYGFAYTYGKTMDNNSGPRDGFIDVYNQQLNWGKSGNDIRHVAVDQLRLGDAVLQQRRLHGSSRPSPAAGRSPASSSSRPARRSPSPTATTTSASAPPTTSPGTSTATPTGRSSSPTRTPPATTPASPTSGSTRKPSGSAVGHQARQRHAAEPEPQLDQLQQRRLPELEPGAVQVVPHHRTAERPVPLPRPSTSRTTRTGAASTPTRRPPPSAWSPARAASATFS